MPSTKIRTLLADPPWAYSDGLTMSKTQRGATTNYTCLSTATIQDFLISRDPPLLLEHDAFLFLWVTNPFLLNGAGASVCEAWGFTPKQLITWVKGRIGSPGKLVLHSGMGHYTRGCTEHMILATRGAPKKHWRDKAIPNIFVALRGAHSIKPRAAFDLVERACPGPYHELFARTCQPGWTAEGNELGA